MSDVLRKLILIHRLRQVDGLFQTDVFGEGFVNQFVQRLDSDFLQHELLFLFIDANVTIGQ